MATKKLSNHALQCLYCGEHFRPEKEEIDLWEQGHSPLPTVCDDCFDMINQGPEVINFSDADPGL